MNLESILLQASPDAAQSAIVQQLIQLIQDQAKENDKLTHIIQSQAEKIDKLTQLVDNLKDEIDRLTKTP